MNDAEVVYKELESLLDFLKAFAEAKSALLSRGGNCPARQQRESCCSSGTRKQSAWSETKHSF